MDPLGAVSLAASIIQFIDFCTKLTSVAREVHSSCTGATAEHSNLMTVIGDLNAITEQLDTSSAQNVTAEEKALQDLAAKCRSLSKEVLGRLNKLKSNHPNSKWESFRIAWDSMRKRGELDSIVRQVDSYRIEISLRLTTMLSAEQSTIGWKLEKLIVEARRLESNIADEFARSRLAITDCIKEHQDRAQPPEWQEVVRLIQGKGMLTTLAEEATRVANGERIIRGLAFDCIHVRHQNIERAHSQTFQWILQEDNTDTCLPQSRSTFKTWLTSGHGIYYISGKAGSGKSTLMKFLCNHPRTREELGVWAGSKTLLFAQFFFWNSGTEMQKSREGLLRTLLYEMLRSEPILIPKLFPDHWEKAEKSSMNLSQDLPITYSDVLAAFDILMNDAEIYSTHRFCFFIDGLDEYAGDHRETVKLFKNWAQSGDVKICLSSRPWNIFEDSFSSDQKLRLQDLTRGDIKQYVEDELETDKMFLKVKEEDHRYEGLVTTIVDKADGVFLWVYLVIRSLLDGLGNDDPVSQLEKRIEALPTGLIPFFNHILETIDPEYRELTARMFFIATLTTEPLSMLAYSLLDDIEENPGFATSAPIRPFSEKEIQKRRERTRRRLDGRCKGLLEINEDPSADPFFKYRVGFLHRTVREFLQTDEVQEELGSRFNKFDAEQSLCHAYLAQVKFVPTTGAYFVKCGPLYYLVDSVIFWARQKEIKSRTPQVLIVAHLEDVLNQHRRRPFSHPDERLENPGWIAWSPSQELKDGENFSLEDFAAYYGLYGYLSWKLRESPDLIHERRNSSLLSCALGITKYPSQHPLQPNPDLVHLLLERGASPTKIWREYIGSFQKSKELGALSVSESLIIENFLKFGANPNVSIPTGTEAGSPSRTSLREFIDISLPENFDTLKRLLQRNEDRGIAKAAGNKLPGVISVPLRVGKALYHVFF